MSVASEPTLPDANRVQPALVKISHCFHVRSVQSGCASILFRSMSVDYVDGSALHRVARVQEVMDAAHQTAFEVDQP